jgi:hypothetical protein
MEVQAEPLLLRVTNVDVLRQHVEALQELYIEVHNYNPRNMPLKGRTKDRWSETLQAASDYFQRFLPKEDTSHAQNDDPEELR